MAMRYQSNGYWWTKTYGNKNAAVQKDTENSIDQASI